jgi:uncharacterized protein DUF3313
MSRIGIAGCAAAILVSMGSASAVQAAKPPATWDDLVQVKAKKADAAYLLPGADFRPYAKVMLDPTEVAFRKNWLRDYNDRTVGLSGRIGEKDAQEMMEKVRTGFGDVFAKEYAAAGYQVVTEPGPDVLRLRTAVINLSVTAPDRPTAGRSRTFSREAGEATLVLEARDSVTGAILGRAVDRQTVGDNGTYLRNSVTNRSDFERLFKSWAKGSINGLNELKAQGPQAATAQR